MTSEEIKQTLNAALQILYRTEIDLINRQLHEQTIVARLMLHLQHLLPEWNVDVEFNRQGVSINEAKEDNQGFNRKPDIIIHRRGPDGPNLAVILVKTYWNNADKEEDKRICRSLKERHRYEQAYFIELREKDWLIEKL
jgi:hypothetical protein